MKQLKPRDKVTQHMTRDGLTLDNQTTGESVKVSSREDEQEYTDYRRYFSYDMEIVSRQGDQEIVANLSKKQGSGAGPVYQKGGKTGG